MKASEIKLKKDVNELIWARGIRKPPRRVRLELERDEDGLVTVGLAPE